jgi:hypothetical protein
MTLRLVPALAGLTGLVCGPALVPALAAGDAMNAMLSEDGKTLRFTPCAEDDAAECLAYALDCRGDGEFGGGLRILVMGNEQEGPNVRTMAKALLDGPFGETRVRFSLAGGGSVELGVSAMTVNEDEMNADWDLSLHSYDQNALFDALTAETAAAVTLTIAGETLTFPTDAKARERILGFKTACAN